MPDQPVINGDITTGVLFDDMVIYKGSSDA